MCEGTKQSSARGSFERNKCNVGVTLIRVVGAIRPTKLNETAIIRGDADVEERWGPLEGRHVMAVDLGRCEVWESHMIGNALLLARTSVRMGKKRGKYVEMRNN